MTTPTSTPADRFRRLHDDGLLLLPNAWDAATARLTESLGAKAVATTSAGVAWSHGYPDGDRLPLPLLVATVAAIARVVAVPLSVDVEGGYADDPAAVAATVVALLDAGAVGINIEDGAAAPDLLAAKIEAAKDAAGRRGVDFFVNARTDVYLRALVPEPRRLDETLARAERYRAAGADGLFVPGLTDPATIRNVAAAVPLPLNVMAQSGLPPAADLAPLGVRRLSAGAAIARFDGTTGKLVQNSGVIADDSGRVGIGAANSGKLLTVTDRATPTTTAGANGILVDMVNGGGIFMTGGTTQGKYEVFGGELGVGTMTNHQTSLYTNNSQRLYISQTGLFMVNPGRSNSDFVVQGDLEDNIIYAKGSNANLGVGTDNPTAKLDVNGDTLRLRTAKTPASATAAGNQGDMAWDSNYVYVCTTTNTWKRAALASW